MKEISYNLLKNIENAEREIFLKRGYLIINNFMPQESIEYILKQIISFKNSNPTIKVRWKHSIFNTINGANIDDNFHELSKIYDEYLIKEILNLYSAKMTTLEDRSVGISVNLTDKGGKFQPHYDRNIITAVLYLNDNYKGGEMVLYPRIRWWLGRQVSQHLRLTQIVLDRIVRSKWYLALFTDKIKVKPKAGDLLVFEGVRTLHTVLPVKSGEVRVSVQFAYDLENASIDTSDYYGKST